MQPRHTTIVRVVLPRGRHSKTKKISVMSCSEFCADKSTPRAVDSHASCLRPAAQGLFSPAVQAIKLVLILEQALLELTGVVISGRPHVCSCRRVDILSASHGADHSRRPSMVIVILGYIPSFLQLSPTLSVPPLPAAAKLQHRSRTAT